MPTGLSLGLKGFATPTTVSGMLSEPPGADPHAGWCGRGRGEPGAYPIFGSRRNTGLLKESRKQSQLPLTVLKPTSTRAESPQIAIPGTVQRRHSPPPGRDSS